MITLTTAVEGERHGAVVSVHEGRANVSKNRQGGTESARGCSAAQGFWSDADEDAGDGENNSEHIMTAAMI